MKKNLFRSGFNLIEVTMAIAIVGIGIDASFDTTEALTRSL